MLSRLRYTGFLTTNVRGDWVPSLSQNELTTEQRLEQQLRADAKPGFLSGFPFMRTLQIILDAAIICASFLVAFLIRFDGRLSSVYVHQVLTLAPIIVVLRLMSNWGFGVYRRLWRYTGLTEIMEL